jgi:tetratricopeptide (TPR) repeat protein
MQALDELQAGTSDKARLTLARLLVVEPDNAAGKSLFQQLDADPLEMLGKEHFLYKSQPGDTLSRIAKRFLGDPYKFYILAKYNGIQVPGRLEAGHSLKVPSKGLSAAAVESASQGGSDTSDLKLLEARKLLAANRFQDAINMLESTLREDGGNAELRDFLVTVYLDYSASLASGGHLVEARGILARGLAAYPDNKRLKTQSELLARKINVEQTYQAGLKAIKEGAWDKAYESFVAVLAAKPDYLDAKARLTMVRPHAIESYHRNATKAYRKQDMDEAIKNWDKVLEIDPRNTLAKSNRAKAVELSGHLKNLSR